MAGGVESISVTVVRCSGFNGRLTEVYAAPCCSRPNCCRCEDIATKRFAREASRRRRSLRTGKVVFDRSRGPNGITFPGVGLYISATRTVTRSRHPGLDIVRTGHGMGRLVHSTVRIICPRLGEERARAFVRRIRTSLSLLYDSGVGTNCVGSKARIATIRCLSSPSALGLGIGTTPIGVANVVRGAMCMWGGWGGIVVGTG